MSWLSQLRFCFVYMLGISSWQFVMRLGCLLRFDMLVFHWSWHQLLFAGHVWKRHAVRSWCWRYCQVFLCKKIQQAGVYAVLFPIFFHLFPHFTISAGISTLFWAFGFSSARYIQVLFLLWLHPLLHFCSHGCYLFYFFWVFTSFLSVLSRYWCSPCIKTNRHNRPHVIFIFISWHKHGYLVCNTSIPNCLCLPR